MVIFMDSADTALNRVCSPASRMIHRNNFFYVMGFYSKTELILFISHNFSHSEPFPSALFVSLKLYSELFLLVGVSADLVF